MNRGVDHAGRRRRGHQWAAAARAFDVQEGNLLTVMRPKRSRCVSIKLGNFLRVGGITPYSPELPLVSFAGTREKRQGLRIRGPREIEISPLTAYRKLNEFSRSISGSFADIRLFRCCRGCGLLPCQICSIGR